nr:MAG TPA: hypothetical protein [Caudoviricetes sp.]
MVYFILMLLCKMEPQPLLRLQQMLQLNGNQLSLRVFILLIELH